MEPLWPWDQVSDQDANLFALEQRSYARRPNVGGNDWSYDAVDAARLELPSQVQSNLVSLTETHQVYPNGLADIGSSVGYQPYQEQSANVAAAVDEALAQDYDGIIRFAPAWPSDWDVSGSVYIQHEDKVDVQVQGGQLVTAAIQAATTGTLKVKSPWPGQQVQVVNGTAGQVVTSTTTSDVFTFPAQAGQSYLVEQASAPTTSLPSTPVTGTPATAVRHLLCSAAAIGVGPPVPCTVTQAYDNAGISSDTDTTAGNLDGSGNSYSEQALTAAGLAPGASVTAGGITYTWPDVGEGQPDNVAAGGQTIEVSGSGAELGFLGTGSNGTQSGTGQITYTDGTTQSFTLSFSDWWANAAPSDGGIVTSMPYLNSTGGRTGHQVSVYYATVPLQAGKAVQDVTLPGNGNMHIFAAALGA